MSVEEEIEEKVKEVNEELEASISSIHFRRDGTVDEVGIRFPDVEEERIDEVLEKDGNIVEEYFPNALVIA